MHARTIAEERVRNYAHALTIISEERFCSESYMGFMVFFEARLR